MSGNIFSKRRSIRLYRQDPLSKEDIEFIVDAGRLAPSAMNLQPLKFFVVVSEEKKNALFPLTRWAGYVKPRRIPKEGERPVAYIVVCSDNSISTSPYIPYDVGAAVSAMLLAATSKGIGSCWLGAIDKEAISQVLDIPESFTVHCAISLGLPVEKPVIDVAEGDIKYFLDGEDVLHIPKRELKTVLQYR